LNVVRNSTYDAALMAARVRIPQGVVYRSFVMETVILNLETGLYHSVNPTGGRVLEVLEKSGSVQEAAELLAAEYGTELSEVESDLHDFCEALLERRLLVIERS
jgi:Coenzyme PQQ synthesis protein D (PqqD)